MSLLSQASLVVVPSGYKEDVVYSVKPTDGSGDLTFTRASDGTRVNSSGLVENVPWNLVTYSEQFDNAAWGKTRLNTTGTPAWVNVAVSPNGTTTAEKLMPTTDNNSHFISFTATKTASVFSQSVYAKAGEYSVLQINNQDDSSFANFNLSTGVVGTVSGYTASITSVGNGWYRCEATKTYIANTSDIRFAIVTSPTSTRLENFAGNGSDGLYIWGAQLNQGSTAKPYFPTTNRQDVPRLTYEGGCPSLLLEKQSTNLITYSEQFDNAVHYKLDVTITANNITSPDGTQNADKFTETTGTGEHIVYDIDSNATGTYTLSAFFKGGAGTIYPVLRLNGSSTTAYAGCIFDTSTGAVINTFYNTYSAPTTKVENMGNGWYRVSMTTTTTDANFGMRIASSNSTSPSVGAYGAISYTGSTSNYFYVWGAQLEASSYATSYIPTTSSSATRVADACFKTGVSSLIGQTEGTLYFELQRDNTDNDTRLQISDGTTNNWLFVSIETGLNPRVYCNVGGVNQFSAYGSAVSNSTHKVALAYKSNDFKVYIDGIASITQTSGSVPACNRIDVGSASPNGAVVSTSLIKEVVLFPTRLTNAELAALTTL